MGRSDRKNTTRSPQCSEPPRSPAPKRRAAAIPPAHCRR
ncbi:hypothetical protein T261_02473 [Streptomyces lydicus]|nr:hypothetical protein T261_02473 [Streptomyces lydicus]